MSKEQVRIRQTLYWNRFARLENQKTISEFSNRKGKIVFDRSNARYLVEKNIRDDVAFNLKIGCRRFFEENNDEQESDEEEKDDEERGESGHSFSVFCKWACLQPQQSLKEVFGGADFVCYRMTLRDTTKALIVHKTFRGIEPKIHYSKLKDFMNSNLSPPRNKPWARVALKAGDVIMLGADTTYPFLDDSEEEESDEEDEAECAVHVGELDGKVEKMEEEDCKKEETEVEADSEKGEEESKKKTEMELYVMYLNDMQRRLMRQQIYSGIKFEHYMTSENAQDETITEKKLRSRIFETVMTGDVTEEGFEPIRVCSFAEVDAFRGDEPIELKSVFKESFYNKLHTYFHCNFGNTKSFVTGFRDDKWITTRVIERRTTELEDDFHSRSHGESKPHEKSYAFLYDILAMTKHILTRSKACRFVYLPKSGIIQFEPLTMAEAKKRGFDFTEDFKKRFQID